MIIFNFFPLFAIFIHRIAAQQTYQNAFIGGTSSFGSFRGSVAIFNNLARIQSDDWNDIWIATKTVPEKLPELPQGRAIVQYPSGIYIRPNDTVTSGLVFQEPKISWESEPNTLYTVIMVDVDLPPQPTNPALNFMHYMVTNVPGNDISRGDIVLSYMPTFTFNFSPEEGRIIEDPNYTHRYLFLIYEQTGRINVPAETNPCSPELAGRQKDLADYVREYNLGSPVAGNFLRNRFSESSKIGLCILSKCVGQPFPVPLPGINDGPLCQPEV